MDLLGFLDCLKYLRLLEPVIQGFFVGIKIDIQVVFYYAAALILHCIDNAVDEELRSQGELVQVGRDGVVFFGNAAELGYKLTAPPGLQPLSLKRELFGNRLPSRRRLLLASGVLRTFSLVRLPWLCPQAWRPPGGFQAHHMYPPRPLQSLARSRRPGRGIRRWKGTGQYRPWRRGRIHFSS